MPSSLVVTTPNTNRNLTTVQAVQLELGSAVDPAWAQVNIQRVSARIEAYCQRVFARETVTETWRSDRGLPQTDLRPAVERLGGTKRGSLRLARTPVAGTPTITLDPEGSAPVVLTAADYRLNPATGVILRINALFRGIFWPACTISVAYAGGFKLPGETDRDLPFDLEMAAIDFIRLRYFARTRDPQVRSETIDGMGQQAFFPSSAADGDIPETIRAVLDMHRRETVA